MDSDPLGPVQVFDDDFVVRSRPENVLRLSLLDDGARRDRIGRRSHDDGSIRIAWLADGYEAVLVRAPFRTREELAGYARGIADEALFERTVASLRVALRARYPGAFDLVTHQPAGRPWSVVVTFHPPMGTARPDV